MKSNFHIGNLYQVQKVPSILKEEYPILIWNIKENRWTLPTAPPYWNPITYGTYCLFLDKTKYHRTGVFLVNDKIIGIPYDVLL